MAMHLIFDLDGTLFQAEYQTLFAAKAVSEELGIESPDERIIVENIGRPMEMFLKNIFPECSAPDEIQEKFRGYERQAIREHGLLFPGISDMLRQLFDAGHMLSICSNGSTEYIELVLNSTGIREYFVGVYTARLHESKADFVAGLLRPDEQAVFIGDSYDDIDAGVRNKIPSIAAMYGYGNKNFLSHAAFAASVPEEITGYVNQIETFSQIAGLLIKNSRRVIGINGIDTSGKTVFADNFARYLRAVGLKCAVIHMDDFHNPLELRRSGADDIDAYYRNAFNYNQLICEVLQPLREHGCVEKDVLCLNLDTDLYENIRHFSIAEDTVLLLEGVLLFRPPVTDYLDGRIYLHIDFDEMLRRAYIRDIPRYGVTFLRKYADKYIPVQKRYLEELAPHINCDVFIDNSDYLRPEIRCNTPPNDNYLSELYQI